jgi:hypothetical protein
MSVYFAVVLVLLPWAVSGMLAYAANEMYGADHRPDVVAKLCFAGGNTACWIGFVVACVYTFKAGAGWFEASPVYAVMGLFWLSSTTILLSNGLEANKGED